MEPAEAGHAPGLYGIYWGTQNLINTVFTITVSFLVADTNWRWFCWLLSILAGSGTLMVFFIVPETRFSRSPLAMNGQVYHTDEFGVTQILTVSEAEHLGIEIVANEGNPLSPKTTYLQSLNPFSPPAPTALRLGIGALAKMVSALSSPAVIWAVLATSISLGTGISMTLRGVRRRSYSSVVSGTLVSSV